MPDPTTIGDILAGFCHKVVYLSSEDVARTWIREHPGSFVLTVQGAFAVGRVFTRRLGV